jgi:hypothetical protein
VARFCRGSPKLFAIATHKKTIFSISANLSYVVKNSISWKTKSDEIFN